MADAVPAGPSPFAGQACPERGESARQAHTSTSHKPRPQKRSRESENEQPAQPAAAAPTPAVAQPGPEAKRSTVDAALSVFRREFPDFTEDDSREALSSCYRTDNTIQMCASSSMAAIMVSCAGDLSAQMPVNQLHVVCVQLFYACSPFFLTLTDCCVLGSFSLHSSCWASICK